MLRSHRTLEAPALGAVHVVTAWLERRARVHATTTRGIVCDDRLFRRVFGRSDASHRALATVVLRGRAFVAVPGHALVLGEGEGVVLPSKEACLTRLEGSPYESLVVEWELPPGADAPPLERFVAADARALAVLAARVHAADAPDAATIASVVAALRASGPPLAGLEPERWVGPVEARFQDLARAIDAALDDMHGQPMSHDLEARLGLSTRQLRRLVEEFNGRYGLGATNWLDTRSRRRLLLGAAFLTHPDATVASVASLVGYRRPETMARAFANAGFPPPSRVRDTVRGLRDEWEAAVRASRPT